MKIENRATRRKTELKKSKDPEEDDSSGIKSRNKEAARNFSKEQKIRKGEKSGNDSPLRIKFDKDSKKDSSISKI